MKIQIDLNEILGDPEYGVETLQDSVKRQVVAALTQKVQKGIDKKIDEEVALAIDKSIKENIANLTPAIFEEMLTATYQPVDSYGRKSEPTTMRQQLIVTLQNQAKYEKNPSYSGRDNHFTQAIDKVVESMIADFKKQFDTKVTELFTKEAFEYAQKTMAAKLGLKL